MELAEETETEKQRKESDQFGLSRITRNIGDDALSRRSLWMYRLGSCLSTQRLPIGERRRIQLIHQLLRLPAQASAHLYTPCSTTSMFPAADSTLLSIRTLFQIGGCHVAVLAVLIPLAMARLTALQARRLLNLV